MTSVQREGGSPRALLASDHWWSAGMRDITLQCLQDQRLRPGPILELGCGQGDMLAALRIAYPDRAILGLDLHAAGAKAASTATVCQADLQKLPLPANLCAAILALDVYDQRGIDLDLALRETWRVLQPGGILVLRVSAYEWLRGPHDDLFGTGRRYAHRPLAGAIEQAGFELRRLTYANTLLLPPTILLRLLQQRHLLPVRWELTPPRWLNEALRVPLAIERRWLRRRNLAAGLSLYAVAAR